MYVCMLLFTYSKYIYIYIKFYLCFRTNPVDNDTLISTMGTTAEIYEYLPQDGTSGFRIKAKARQRFKLLDVDSR